MSSPPRATRHCGEPDSSPFAFDAIARGELVRWLPGWDSDAGPLSIYYPSRRPLPGKTRVFVDDVCERVREAEFARWVDGR